MHAKVIELDNRIRVGAVSYLNTRPLIYGVKRSSLLMEQIILTEEYPSRIASRLLNDEIDIGLIPVAVIPLLKEHHIVTDYCIGSENEVASVAIFSEVPIDQVDTLLLDYQSRTSVNLAKVLLQHYWKKEVLLKEAKEDFRNHITGTTAAGLPYGLFNFLYILAVIIPGLAVAVRRLHDVGKSGWFSLIILIPVVGIIWLFILLCKKGIDGENKYGFNPEEMAIE